MDCPPNYMVAVDLSITDGLLAELDLVKKCDFSEIERFINNQSSPLKTFKP